MGTLPNDLRRIEEIDDRALRQPAEDRIIAEVRLKQSPDRSFRQVTVGGANDAVRLQSFAQLALDILFETPRVALETQDERTATRLPGKLPQNRPPPCVHVSR